MSPRNKFMVNDNEIKYLEAEVRRIESDLSAKKLTGTPEEVKKLEEELARKKLGLSDLKSRKRREEDQQRRADVQKKMDDRRKGPGFRAN